MEELNDRLIKTLERYKASGIEEQVDYEKFYLYSIVTHSTAIEGSTVTEVENQLLFDEGIAVSGRSMMEQMMNVDLKEAYVEGFKMANSSLRYNRQILCDLASMVMRRTGAKYSMMAGSFDSSLGELRLCNVSAGIGGRSYLAFSKVPKAVDEFCLWLNQSLASVDSSDIAACYRLSFDAHYRLVTIHPWVDGNGRTTRLVMNMIQRRLDLVPSIVSSGVRAQYIQALVDAREHNDTKLFEDEMIRQHIANMESRISQYLSSLDDTINKNDDTINDTITQRQREIVSLISRHPGITRIALAASLNVSVPTIARELAILIDKGFIARVGGKKSGYIAHL